MTKTIILGAIIVGIIISAGITMAYAINITLAGDAAVTGNLDVAGDLTGPTIDGINSAISSSGGCTTKEIQHWNKIIFDPLIIMTHPNTSLNLSPLNTYEIIEMVNPSGIIDTTQLVINKMTSLGYNTPIFPQSFIVFDVEYAIICAQPPL